MTIDARRASGGSAHRGAACIAPPSAADAASAVLIAGAMGVQQDFYAEFAHWLAGQGYVVADLRLPRHRAIASARARIAARLRRRPVRLGARHRRGDRRAAASVPATCRSTSSATAWARSCPGCCAHRDRIAGLVIVAAGSGYWRDNAPPLKRMVLYFWHVLVPLATCALRLLSGRAPAEGRRPAARRDPAVAALVPEPALPRRRRGRGAARAVRGGRASRSSRCRSPTTS